MKNRLLRWGSLSLLAALSLILFYACNQDNNLSSPPNPKQNALSIYLTDGPGYFDKVNVDIQIVAVKIDTSTRWWPDTVANPWKHKLFDYCSNHDVNDANAIWDTLQITPGVYN
ncbi:MAG: hypothetical protein ACRDE2_12080, partial [Chitinophagaceae bacterium]